MNLDVVEDLTVKGEASRRARRRRRAWITAILTAIVVTVPVILFLTHWPFTREKITADIQRLFPGPVTIQKFHRIYFPHPGCVAEGVTVGSTSSNPQGLALILDRLEIQGAYSSVLSGSKAIDLQGQGLHLFLPPHGILGALGQTNGQDKSKTIVNDLQIDHALIEVAREGKDPLRFDVHQLRVGPLGPGKEMKFHIALTNPLPRGEASIDGRCGPWEPGKLAEIPISGSYTLEQANLGVFSALAGMVSSAGKFHGLLANFTVDGWTRSPNFEIRASGHPVSLDGRFRADVNGTNGDVYLRDTSFSWEKTTLVGTGEITGRPKQHGKTVNVSLAVDRGRIEDLMLIVMKSSPTMRGPVRFKGRAVLPPLKEKFMERVQFTADFGIENGLFTRPGAQKGIDKLSERARGDKDDDLERVLAALKGHVALRDGVARVSNATLTVPAAAVQFEGKCNMLNKQLDLHGKLRMIATLSEASTGFKSVLLKVVNPFFKDKKHNAGSEVPVKMTGTFGHPQIGIDLAHK